MDEELQDTYTYEYTFTAVEIDLDYEFDAARYFDFSREETPAEAREAERWFESAASYPPSPFIVKLAPRVDLLLENVNTSPKQRDADDMNLEKDRETSINVHAYCIQKFQNQIQNIQSGLTFYNHMIKDNFRTKTKSTQKPSLPRGSTLMKPTASQLAKQHKPQPMDGSRFQKSLADKNKKGSGNHCVVELQAAKRQKLEGGHLRKVGETNQPLNFVHKEPKKDATGDINSMQGKLRITIPQEPNLETAHRAQRMRSKTIKEADSLISAIPRFKARPLNSKILEAPSLLLRKRCTPLLAEFQVSKSSTTSTIECGKKESRRPNLMDTLKQEGLDVSRNFKALPLNKKIFTSKGGLGVFRNTKRETTVPMEFYFQTDNRVHHNPPIELFNKLSLASEPQPSAGSQLKPPWSTGLPGKGSKENRWGYLPEECGIKRIAKEKLPWVGGKQHQCSSNGRMNELGPAIGISSRSLGIC